MEAKERGEKAGAYIGSSAEPMPLLTTEDVAQILKKTSWVVCSYVRAGKLHAYRIGHEFRFSPQMIEGFLKVNRV